MVTIPLFLSRVQSLQLHHELELAHLCTSTDVNEGRASRRAWQQRLNCQIQQMTLQLLVSIFRYLKPLQGCHLVPSPLPVPRRPWPQSSGTEIQD